MSNIKRKDIFDVLEERTNPIGKKHYSGYNAISEKNNESSYERNVLSGIHGNNSLNQLFFCKKNVDIVQNMIRGKVYEKTKQIIGRQNDTDLIIIMRAVYFQFARHLPSNITQQIANLNEKTVEDIMPKLLSNIEQHKEYLKNKEALPQPIDRSINVNMKGTKQLRSVTTTF